MRGVAAVALLLAAAPALGQYDYADVARLGCVEADRRLTQGIEAGDPVAPFTKARLVAVGACFARSQDDYVALLAKASERGNTQAMGELGLAHALGGGVPQDYTKAGALFRRAGEGASVADDYTLGFIRGTGRIVRQNSVDTANAWWAFEHRLAVQFTINPVEMSYELGVTRIGPVAEGAQAEAERSLASVRADIADAWRKSLRRMPPPDRARLQSARYVSTWIISILPSEWQRVRWTYDDEAQAEVSIKALRERLGR